MQVVALVHYEEEEMGKKCKDIFSAQCMAEINRFHFSMSRIGRGHMGDSFAETACRCSWNRFHANKEAVNIVVYIFV